MEKAKKGIQLPNGNILFNGVEYTQEERRAEVGDTIFIVNPWMAHGYGLHDVLTIDYTDYPVVYAKNIPGGISQREYVVISPVRDNPNLLTRINAAINELNEIRRELLREVVCSQPTVDKQSQPPVSRQAIVEKAKADVVELEEIISVYPPQESGIGLVKKYGQLTPTFVINREKRTIVCLLFLKYVLTERVARGIAKCTPDDCFNVHIGKAIALRRALGLDVPEAYLNAPQPERAEVGDVVRDDTTGKAYTLDGRCPERDSLAYGRAFELGRYYWAGEKQFTIIDDSRDE